MYGGYFRRPFYARKRRAARALTFRPRVFSAVASRAAAPRPGALAAAHPQVLLHSDPNAASSSRIGRNLRALLHADVRVHAGSLRPANRKLWRVASRASCFPY